MHESKTALKNPDFFRDEADSGGEEEQILSLNSLREAFVNFQSPPLEEHGFYWDNRGFSPQRARTIPIRPGIAEESADFSDAGDSETPSRSPDFIEEESTISFFEDQENANGEFSELGGEEEAAEFPLADRENIDLNPLSLLESMLFVGNKENRSLSREKASELMRNVSPEEVEQLAEQLNARYAFWNCPYEVVREESGYRLSLRDDFESIRTRFYGRIKEARLSQSAIDVLSVVAYKQPITAEQVQKIRKQSSGPILSQLVRRELLDIDRKTEGKRRISYYRTTERFLQLFGLESLDDLPITEEIADYENE